MHRCVAAFRRFNRFHTRLLGLFSPRLLATPLSLAQARTLYEIAARPGAHAAALGRDLGMDRAQVSRILARLRDQGLIRLLDPGAGRRGAPLEATDKGLETLRDLNRAADTQAARLLAGLNEHERARLAGALATTRALLARGEARAAAQYEMHAHGAASENPDAPGQSGPQACAPADATAGKDATQDRTMARQAPWAPQTPQESAATPTPGAVTLRPARSGDMGRVITHHADVYGAEYGFTGEFERYVLLGLAALARGSNEHEGLWIAERDGTFLGCVGVVMAEGNAAQLRWLLVLPEARGLGLGRRLVACVVDFCRAQGYARILLWTLRALDAARGLYASSGFHLAEARDGTMGGRPHVEERWEMELATRIPRPDDAQR